VALFVALRAVLVSAVYRAGIRDAHRLRPLLQISTFLSAATASWLSLPLLNGPQRSPPSSNSNGSAQPASRKAESHEQAGKTLDLTLLASVRALETVIYHSWQAYVHSSSSSASLSRLRRGLISFLSTAADPALFIASAGTVMWAWVYEPHRLPHGYNRWITSAAEVDPRLIEVLQAIRAGKFAYGKDTGAAGILTPMCRDYNWPEEWGDPAKTIPVPCTMVHNGLAGSSCHAYAAVRFARAFRFSFLMYLPLQLLLRLRSSPHIKTRAKLIAALREASRSSAFLGAFIALFYYAVCLSRTVIGPRVFPKHVISAQQWDAGLCVGAGCAACGWSVILEPRRRRQELAGFVAPRALATCLPRRYAKGKFVRERAAFALSFGVLAAGVRQGPEGVRGVLGSLLHGVLQ
jgi:hypothetical protein